MGSVGLGVMDLRLYGEDVLQRIAAVLENKAALGRADGAPEDLANLLEVYARAMRGAVKREAVVHGVLSDLGDVAEVEIMELHGDLCDCIAAAHEDGDTLGAQLLDCVAAALLSELVRREAGGPRALCH